MLLSKLSVIVNSCSTRKINLLSWSVVQGLRKYTTKNETKDYDIVISGGGMVGASFLCAVGSNDALKRKKILLLEKGDKTQPKEIPENYSNRCVALNPNTKQFLSDIGVWDRLNTNRIKPVKRLQVWDACSESLITFNNDDMEGEVAHIVENDLLLSSINEQIDSTKSENINIMYKSDVGNYVLPKGDNDSEDPVSIHLPDGRKINTKLLIGADGAMSAVRSKMDVKYLNWSYNQRAVVATLKLSEPSENNTAWQRFLPSGPVALLPLTDELSSLVWTTTNDEAKRLLQMSNEEFVDALNVALWDDSNKNNLVDSATSIMSGLLKTVFPDGSSMLQLPPSIINVEENSRVSFPLGLGHSSRYVAKRVALVGDSAHKVHPLAGQGVNLGFGDVKCLVDILAKCVRNGCQLGDIDHLHEYETSRQRHVVPVMLAIDGLNRLYSTDLTTLVLLRSLGLQITNSLPFVKKQFMKHASL